MEPADSIGRLGFSRWYERRLIEAHAWFVTSFVSLIAVVACLEELSYRGSALRLAGYAAVVALCAAAGLYGVIRYQKILLEAERIGQQATCPACGAYARFSLISASRVRCRKCRQEWRLLD